MTSRTRTVAELLLRHAEARSSGVLTLLRGQVKKQLYLHDGVLVSADSNLREEALGAVLVELGLLPASRLNQLLGEVKKRGQKMGRVLTDLGWVSPDDVLFALAEQVRGRVVSCLRWPESETSFEATTNFVGNLIEHRFELAPLVFAGLRDTSTLDLLAATLDQESGRAVQLDPRFNQYRADFVVAFGAHVAEVLESGIDIAQLVLRPDASVLAYGLDAMIATNLTSLEDTGRGARDSFSGEPTAFDQAPAGLQEPGETPPPAALIDGLAELVRSPTTGGARRMVLDRATGGTGAHPPELPDDLKREYLEIHGRAPSEVLGIGVAATQQQISEAYESKRARVVGLASLLNPGKGSKSPPTASAEASPTAPDAPMPPDRKMLEELLEAYARARAALASRAAAAEGAEAWAPAASPTVMAPSTMPGLAAVMDPLGAELAFGEGRSLLESGAAAEAIEHLQEAVDSRPDQAAYHAWLGLAVWKVRGRPALGEVRDRLEHALLLDPDSTDAHTIMGSILLSSGDAGAARGHLERTLALRPDQREALDQLAGIYLEAGESAQAEKLYRRVLSALGDREAALRAHLWEELASLYEGPLADPTAAARAHESAAQLAPR